MSTPKPQPASSPPISPHLHVSQQELQLAAAGHLPFIHEWAAIIGVRRQEYLEPETCDRFDWANALKRGRDSIEPSVSQPSHQLYRVRDGLMLGYDFTLQPGERELSALGHVHPTQLQDGDHRIDRSRVIARAQLTVFLVSPRTHALVSAYLLGRANTPPATLET